MRAASGIFKVRRPRAPPCPPAAFMKTAHSSPITSRRFLFDRGVLVGPQEHPLLTGPGELRPPCPAGRLETGRPSQRVRLPPRRSRGGLHRQPQASVWGRPRPDGEPDRLGLLHQGQGPASAGLQLCQRLHGCCRSTCMSTFLIFAASLNVSRPSRWLVVQRLRRRPPEWEVLPTEAEGPAGAEEGDPVEVRTKGVHLPEVHSDLRPPHRSPQQRLLLFLSDRCFSLIQQS